MVQQEMKQQTEQSMKNSKKLAYAALALVVVLWGISPLATLYFYQYYSPTIRVSFSAMICAISMMIIARKKWNLLNKSYFKVAIPTGFFMATANIMQKIGLQYTTPTNYAFLEKLSVLMVPILLYVFIKKKPGILTILGAVLCLASSFALTGMKADMNRISLVGDLLCALAGIFYGVNIAGTGAFAKKFYTPLYLMIQMFVEMTVSAIGAVVFHVTGIERIMFDFDWRMILANIVYVLVISTFCWLIRTNAMKRVDASVVAVMMSFSSVVTMVLSVLAGSDVLTASLVVGAVLGLVSIILSALGDR